MGGYSCFKKVKAGAAWWAAGTSKERKGSYGCGKHETKESGHRVCGKAHLGICDDALVLCQGEDGVQERSRHDGVRHSGRCAGGDSHCCHHCVSAEDPRAVGCHCNRDQQFVDGTRAFGAACGAARRLACGGGKGAPLRKGFLLRPPRLAWRLTSESGQGTLEYALVMFGFLSIVAGLGALWNMLDGGLLVSHALASASHHVQAVTPGAVADVFAF